MEPAVTDLPEPDSPTTPTTVLRGMGEVHLDCLDRAGVRHEGDRQVTWVSEIALLGIVLRVCACCVTSVLSL